MVCPARCCTGFGLGAPKKNHPFASHSTRDRRRAERLGRPAPVARRPVGGGRKKYSMFTPKLRPLAARGMPRTVLHRVSPGDAEKKSPSRIASLAGGPRAAWTLRQTPVPVGESVRGRKKKSSKFTPKLRPRASPGPPRLVRHGAWS